MPILKTSQKTNEIDNQIGKISRIWNFPLFQIRLPHNADSKSDQKKWSDLIVDLMKVEIIGFEKIWIFDYYYREEMRRPPCMSCSRDFAGIFFFNIFYIFFWEFKSLSVLEGFLKKVF